jgi:hypothetical protein
MPNVKVPTFKVASTNEQTSQNVDSNNVATLNVSNIQQNVELFIRYVKGWHFDIEPKKEL